MDRKQPSLEEFIQIESYDEMKKVFDSMKLSYKDRVEYLNRRADYLYEKYKPE